MFVTYNTKYKTYITMSKSSTISLDVLNALSPQGMLNASVKELENQVFTFHSIVAPAEKLRILLLSAMTTRM
jgi:hypothetical protein